MQDHNPYSPPSSAVDDRTPASTAAVSVIPFVLICLAIIFVCLVISTGLSVAFGFYFPALNGLIAAIVSVGITAWIFGRRHRRQLLPSERTRLTFGCFLVFWFFDTFLKIVVRVSNGVETTARQLAVDVAATVVDFLIILAIVFLLVPMLIRLSPPSGPSPNKSLERARGE